MKQNQLPCQSPSAVSALVTCADGTSPPSAAIDLPCSRRRRRVLSFIRPPARYGHGDSKITTLFFAAMLKLGVLAFSACTESLGASIVNLVGSLRLRAALIFSQVSCGLAHQDPGLCLAAAMAARHVAIHSRRRETWKTFELCAGAESRAAGNGAPFPRAPSAPAIQRLVPRSLARPSRVYGGGPSQRRSDVRYDVRALAEERRDPACATFFSPAPLPFLA
ncbi:unnamed protein product [Lampetra fluviatilis]